MPRRTVTNPNGISGATAGDPCQSECSARADSFVGKRAWLDESVGCGTPYAKKSPLAAFSISFQNFLQLRNGGCRARTERLQRQTRGRTQLLCVLETTQDVRQGGGTHGAKCVCRCPRTLGTVEFLKPVTLRFVQIRRLSLLTEPPDAENK